MIDNIPEGDWPSIIAVVVANVLVIWQNNSALGKQTRKLRGMFLKAKRDTHRDLEQIRSRIAAVEQKVEGLLGRRVSDTRTATLTGGESEALHLPPNTGGQDRTLE